MFSRAFVLKSLERVVAVFATALLGAMGAGFVFTDRAQWVAALTSAAFAAGLEALRCLSARRVGDPESPSMLGKVVE